MSNFRIAPSVLVLVSSVGLNANAQTSAPSITDKGSIAGFNYSISNKPRGGVGRDLMADIINRNVTFSTNNNFQYQDADNIINLNLSNNDGFRGVYSYEGQTGTIEADVFISLYFYDPSTSHIGDSHIKDIIIGRERNIVMGNYNFGRITTSYSQPNITDSGKFSISDAELSVGPKSRSTIKFNKQSLVSMGNLKGVRR